MFMNRMFGGVTGVALGVVLVAGCGTTNAVTSGNATGSAAPTVKAIAVNVTPANPSKGCAGVGISVPVDAKGSSTPKAAIDIFLRTGMTQMNLPFTGWALTSPGLYASGTAVIDMTHLPNGGYLVTSARTC
jgi:hypothetical protein